MNCDKIFFQNQHFHMSLHQKSSSTLDLNELSINTEEQFQSGSSNQIGLTDERFQSEVDTNNKSQQGVKGEWTLQQEEKLFNLHDQLGNKWAIIAKQLAKWTDNGVKNHFYSKLRKSLRKLNKIIASNFKRKFKEIKVSVIYKIIEATQQLHKQNPFCDSQTSDYCTKLKNRLLQYSSDEDILNNYQQNQNLANELIFDLVNFSKNYRRKSKKQKKNGNPQNDSLHSNILQTKKSGSEDKKIMEDIIFSEKLNDKIKITGIFEEKYKQQNQNQVLPFNNQQKININRQDSLMTAIEQQRQQNQEFDQVQFILKQTEVLEDEYLPFHLEMMTKQSSHIFNQFQDEKEDFRFFEESSAEIRIFSTKHQQFDECFSLLNERPFNIFF